jgi:hypothetical protein
MPLYARIELQKQSLAALSSEHQSMALFKGGYLSMDDETRVAVYERWNGKLGICRKGLATVIFLRLRIWERRLLQDAAQIDI